MAHLRPFLNGTILFSSISPNYERTLKEELFGCFKYIGIPFNVLERMPIRDRKFYIAQHNNAVEAENRSHSGSHVDGEMINKFTDMSMMKGKK